MCGSDRILAALLYDARYCGFMPTGDFDAVDV